MRFGQSSWSRVVAALAPLAYAVHAQAGYVLTPLVGGLSQVPVTPGQSFQVDYWLTSDSGNTHDSAIFQVQLSQPGLVLTSITWSLPYVAALDNSTPALTMLPKAIVNETLDGPAYPIDTADFELSNVSIAGSFGSGLLVSTILQVPVQGVGTSMVSLTVVPDTLALGFGEVQTAAGVPLAITVIPAPPMYFAVMGAIGLAIDRRSRKTI